MYIFKLVNNFIRFTLLFLSFYTVFISVVEGFRSIYLSFGSYFFYESASGIFLGAILFLLSWCHKRLDKISVEAQKKILLLLSISIFSVVAFLYQEFIDYGLFGRDMGSIVGYTLVPISGLVSWFFGIFLGFNDLRFHLNIGWIFKFVVVSQYLFFIILFFDYFLDLL